MKICVWLDRPVNKSSGGVYTYIDTLIRGIDNFSFHPGVEIIFLSVHSQSNVGKPSINITEHQLGLPIFIKVIRRIFKLISNDVFENIINLIDQKEKKIKDKSITEYLKQEGVKLIFYPMQQTSVIDGIPFILNNWDLAHYTTYAFPEIADGGGFYKRNDWYVNIMPGALMIFCETEAGKKEISHYLNFNPDKIKVLPIFSSGLLINLKLSTQEQLTILEKLNIKKQQFFFYPAQFWAHKNHYTLIKAFHKFIGQYPDHKLLLCGGDNGNGEYIKSYVKTLSLEKNVLFTGFIEDDALYTLYKNAAALIMPTFLGPSNIPPIEALHLECPVLCSDLDGHKEMLNDAALYFNPLDDISILESMKAIMDGPTRLQIQQNQREVSKTTHHTIEKALIKLEDHFIEAMNIRNCWD